MTDRPLIGRISNSDISATGHPLYSVLYVWFSVGFFWGSADQMPRVPV